MMKSLEKNIVTYLAAGDNGEFILASDRNLPQLELFIQVLFCLN